MKREVVTLFAFAPAFTITTNVLPESDILRVQIKKGTANLQKDSDIMIDQIRTIDNRRLTKRVGELPRELHTKVKENIKIILDLV